MKNENKFLLQEGMLVTWIDEVPREEGVGLLSGEQVAESVSDRRKEISMAASRIYTANMRLLNSMKMSFGPGPFTVVKVSTEFVSPDTCHPQHITIQIGEDANITLNVSGFWFKPV